MTCVVKRYAGMGECKALRDSIVGFILFDKDHTAITKVNAKTTAGLQAILAPNTIAAIDGIVLDCRNGVEPGGAENEMTTSNVGYTKKTDISPIVIEAYANMSYQDYMNFFGFEDKSLKIGLIDKAGNLWGTNASATNFTGFRGRIFLSQKLPSNGADKMKDFHFHIVFDDMNEWGSNVEILDTAYSVIQVFEDVNPVGLDAYVSIAMAQTTGYVTVQVNYRNSSRPYAGLGATADWSVLSANDVGVAVSAVDATNASLGQYKLTILTGAGGDITGDAIIQGFDLSGSVMTYLTNPVTIHKYTA